MQRAYELAQLAEQKGEVPIGAVLVDNDKIIAEGHNQTIELSDPTAHAEILVLRHAGIKLNNYRLNGTTLYTTLEPCVMCAGALVHARIKTLYFASTDPRGGACGSQFNIVHNKKLNHRIECHSGLFAKPCGDLLSNFFKQRRKSSLQGRC